METSGVQLPVAFVERLRHVLPGSLFEEVLASFARPKIPTVRVNTLKITPKAAYHELQHLGFHPRPLSWCPYAFELPLKEKQTLTESSLCQEGKLYLQNPSSILAVELLDPKPGERVLDLCAAPGGKTSLMAQKMENRGEIVAIEPVKDRFYKLKANLERLGVEIAKLYRQDGRKIRFRDHFDRILVDAPCSAEGCFSLLDPKTFRYWKPRKIKECQRKQIGLLFTALSALRLGGRLLYCTCTFAPEENEEVIERVLRRWKGPPLKLLAFETVFPCQTQEGKGLPAARRILPDERFQGFFLALLTKAS